MVLSRPKPSKAATAGRRRRPSRPAGATKGHIAPDLTDSFVIREAAPKDLETLHALSRHLNSVNLPNNKDVLQRIVRQSAASFGGRVEDPMRREYLFVMEGERSGAIPGTSMLFAQHGHHDAPHIYFDVLRDERYSITLDRHFSHLCLRLGLNYRGPTEIGGLVLDPAYRSLGLGRQLSYVRFLFIAMFRERFRPSVIAELMPPLLPDGRSELWEFLGRHFTGLSYQEADKLSKTNKEFITSLFPQTPLYASLLPEHVQKMIGEVGEGTRGVKRMLEAVGFEYSERIDPFDGGPHFEALTDDITLVKEAQQAKVDDSPLSTAPGEADADPAAISALVGRADPKGACRFRAAQGPVRRTGARVQLTEAMQASLHLKPGASVWWIPMP
jgi:arginine N-succinyltransferase